MKKQPLQLGSITKIFSYGERIQPTRDWLILAGIALVFFFLSIGWNVWLFVQLENGKTLDSSVPTQSAPNAAHSVSAVQTLFQSRATEEQHYQSDYHFVDPSLPGS